MPFEHSKKRIAAEVGVIAAVLGLVVAGGWAILRWAMDLAAENVPASVERPLGKAMAAALDRGSTPCEGPAVVAGVGDLSRALAREAGMDAANLDVKVVDAETVNAFALPGGHVFVYTGLLQKAESPDEVAGVLAHELGHVALRHHVRSAVRALGIGAALSVVVGDIDGLTALMVGGSGELLDRSFGREQEEAADAFAAELASKAGFDPAAVGKLLERMESPLEPPSFLRTHPSGPDRRKRLEELAGKHPVRPGGPAADVSIGALHGSCSKSKPEPEPEPKPE